MASDVPDAASAGPLIGGKIFFEPQPDCLRRSAYRRTDPVRRAYLCVRPDQHSCAARLAPLFDAAKSPRRIRALLGRCERTRGNDGGSMSKKLFRHRVMGEDTGKFASSGLRQSLMSRLVEEAPAEISQ
jgi:hypothetical protein